MSTPIVRSWIRRSPSGVAGPVTPEGVGRRLYWRPRGHRLGLKISADFVHAYLSRLDSAVAGRLRGAGTLVPPHLAAGWESNPVTATAARLTAAKGGRILA